MSSDIKDFVKIFYVLAYFHIKTKIQKEVTRSDEIRPEKNYRHDFILIEFRNKQDFRRASGSMWYWTGSTQFLTLADMCVRIGERTPPFQVGDLRARKAPEIDISR